MFLFLISYSCVHCAFEHLVFAFVYFELYCVKALTDFDVPLSRATWFIKMTAAYHLTLTDTKMKKRATNDPNSGELKTLWCIAKFYLLSLFCRYVCGFFLFCLQ